MQVEEPAPPVLVIDGDLAAHAERLGARLQVVDLGGCGPAELVDDPAPADANCHPFDRHIRDADGSRRVLPAAELGLHLGHLIEDEPTVRQRPQPELRHHTDVRPGRDTHDEAERRSRPGVDLVERGHVRLVERGVEHDDVGRGSVRRERGVEHRLVGRRVGHVVRRGVDHGDRRDVATLAVRGSGRSRHPATEEREREGQGTKTNQHDDVWAFLCRYHRRSATFADRQLWTKNPQLSVRE